MQQCSSTTLNQRLVSAIYFSANAVPKGTHDMQEPYLIHVDGLQSCDNRDKKTSALSHSIAIFRAESFSKYSTTGETAHTNSLADT
jgi:hypothetical protein